MKRMVYVFLMLMFALNGIGQVWIDTGAVYISDPMNRDKTVEVFNYQGAKSIRLSGNENIVNLSELPPGVYLVVIKTEQAQIQSFKILRVESR